MVGYCHGGNVLQLGNHDDLFLTRMIRWTRTMIKMMVMALLIAILKIIITRQITAELHVYKARSILQCSASILNLWSKYFLSFP